MIEKYTKEEVYKIYQELPETLKGVLFSEETSQIINSSCKKNDITESQMEEILILIGEIIIGITDIDSLEKNMIRDLGISIDKAKNISREINRFVIFPIKEDIIQAASKMLEKEVSDNSLDRPKKKDPYREPIE
jgi:hypothetical protein